MADRTNRQSPIYESCDEDRYFDEFTRAEVCFRKNTSHI